MGTMCKVSRWAVSLREVPLVGTEACPALWGYRVEEHMSWALPGWLRDIYGAEKHSGQGHL